MEPAYPLTGVHATIQQDPSKYSQPQSAADYRKDNYDLSIQDHRLPELNENLEDHLQKCKKAYSEHCLEEAYRLMKFCEDIKNKYQGEIYDAMEAQLRQEKELFDRIKSEYEYMLKVLGELNTTEGWIVDSVGSNATLSYKYIKGTELVTIKLETDVDVPIQNMLTLVNEINLWNNWVPFIKRTSELKRLHRSAAVYYVEMGLPYPLHNREVHLYGFAVNRLYENQSILILAESIDENKGFIERNKIKKVENTGTVNMDIHFGGFEITPLERNKCRLRGVANINPKFNWLPVSVLNFVLKKGIHFVLDRLIKKAKNFKGSVWEKEMTLEEKKAFYEWLNQVIEEYYQSQKK